MSWRKFLYVGLLLLIVLAVYAYLRFDAWVANRMASRLKADPNEDGTIKLQTLPTTKSADASAPEEESMADSYDQGYFSD